MIFSDHANTLLQKFYMRPDEKTPIDAFRRAATCFSKGDAALAQRLVEYVSKGWFMFASPVLSNAVYEGEKVKGLPISCFLAYVPDSLEGLIEHSKEIRWLSVKGGGVGGHWSSVRSASDISPGVIPFIKTVDSDMEAYRQGRTRKGNYAAYLDISHPDIMEFLNIRVPTGGDTYRKCFAVHNAINITDDFMKAVVEGKQWNLIDPNTKQVVNTVDARELFTEIVRVRFRTGEPYLNFIDTANKALNPYQYANGLRIKGSNLCTEIHLVTDEQRTAVCCLSSVNLEYFDEWKDTNMVQDLIVMLDNVLQFFIDNAPPELDRAVFSAVMERSLGLGAMGYHSYLQRKGLGWNDWRVPALNMAMFSRIKEQAVVASQKLAQERGEPEDIKGSGMRNAHLLAIAPNANTSVLVDTSPSIEPWFAPAFTARTRAGTYSVKNKYLEKLLEAKGMNTDEVWKDIINHKGSVQHLDFLTEDEKEVYKTAYEIDQRGVVTAAAHRQPYICQGQSVNLFFPAGSDINYVVGTHIKAWKEGLKGLYYLRTESTAKADVVSFKIERNALKDSEACVACEG